MKIQVYVMAMLMFWAIELFAIECPTQPQQSQKDWATEVNLAVARIGPAKGGELKVKAKKVTQDLLGKLPKADRVYLEQMMYATYCSALRDDKTLSETEKGKRINAYNNEIRKTFRATPSKTISKNSITPATPQVNVSGGDYVAGNKTINIGSTEAELERIVRKVANELKPALTKEYQDSYTVFGIKRGGFVVPSGLVPEGVDISWETGSVSYSDQVINLTIPDIVVNRQNVKDIRFLRTKVSLQKRISHRPIKLFAVGDVGIEIRVLGIDKELVIVGLGFPVNK